MNEVLDKSSLECQNENCARKRERKRERTTKSYKECRRQRFKIKSLTQSCREKGSKELKTVLHLHIFLKVSRNMCIFLYDNIYY